MECWDSDGRDRYEKWRRPLKGGRTDHGRTKGRPYLAKAEQRVLGRGRTDGRTEGRKHGRANGECRFGGPLDSKIIIVVVTVEEGMWVTVAVGEGAEA